MDSDHFDALAARLAANLTRRKSLGLLGLGALAGPGLAENGEARKKKKKKRKGKGNNNPVPTTLGPTELLDATCPHQMNPGDGFGPGESIGQTFLAQRSGLLTKAQIIVMKTTGGVDITFEIRNVDGSGKPTTVRSSCVVRDVPNKAGPLACTFASPTSVVQGARYALVVTTSPQQGFIVAVNLPPRNQCPDGHVFVGPAMMSFPDHDLAFETYVTA